MGFLDHRISFFRAINKTQGENLFFFYFSWWARKVTKEPTLRCGDPGTKSLRGVGKNSLYDWGAGGLKITNIYRTGRVQQHLSAHTVCPHGPRRLSVPGRIAMGITDEVLYFIFSHSKAPNWFLDRGGFDDGFQRKFTREKAGGGIAIHQRIVEVPWRKGANCLSGGRAGICQNLQTDQERLFFEW